MKYYLTLLLFLLCNISVFADCTITLGKNGSANFNSCGDYNGSGSYNGDVTISLSKGSSFNFGVPNLIITGNLTINGNGSDKTIIIDNNLTVNGNVTITSINKLDLIINSGFEFEVNGDFDNSGQNGDFTISPTSTLDINGNFSNSHNKTQFNGSGNFEANSVSGTGFDCSGAVGGVDTCDLQFDVPNGCEPLGSDFCNDVGDGNGNPLPIILKNISVNYNNDLLEVKWSTFMEINCDYYQLSISQDGGLYFNLDKLNCNNNYRGFDYFKTYSDIPFDPSYLLFEQYDFDGKISESRIILINKYNNSQSYKIFPNPTPNGILTIITNSVESYYVTNIFNQIVESTLEKIGDSRYSLFIPDVTGLYLLHLNNGIEEKVQKILISK